MEQDKSKIWALFIKNPVKGKVKNRIASHSSNEAALLIYNQLLNKILSVASKVRFPVAVFFSDFVDENGIFGDSRFERFVQKGNDIGQRMYDVFNTLFTRGYRKVVLTGGDIPGMTEKIVVQALNSLDKADVVIGPAVDGGYYLIGMKKAHPELFHNKSWGTAKVFRQTMEEVRNLQLSAATLPVLRDVDNIEDIEHFPELKYLIKKKE